VASFRLLSLTAVVLVVLGLVGVIVRRGPLAQLIAVNVMGAGALLLFGGVAARDPAGDPVPHAMILTGIVVTVAATGAGTALIRRLHALEVYDAGLGDESGSASGGGRAAEGDR